MKTSTTHITKPSSNLLQLVRKIQADKEVRQEDLKANWSKFFPKKE
ncbi:hypothetical protein QWY99_01060 [Flavobacterium branchiarum]|uniref:DUF721 domain-containing protein n=1 Tax=Flavobacterium branchiarum TaxID=1114870 RepID=A0ABV5FR16_9FLAO|nr:hypothetical protein [Flavobacterium branchiarum]MDN3671654.1 hypothetical protein [Flavobacterium branchiarum]